MRKYLIIAGVIVIFSGAWIAGKSGGNVRANDSLVESKRSVKTEKVTTGEIAVVAGFPAVIRGEQEVDLAPKISGRVINILKKEGDFVQQGELLAVIDGAEFLAQEVVSRENFNLAKNSAKNTEEYYSQTVDEAEAGMQKAEKALDVAKDSGSDGDIDLAKKNVAQAEEAVRTAKKMRDLQIQISADQKDIAQGQLGVSAAYARNTRLTAPFSGVITRKNFDIGSLASPQQAIFSIAQSENKEAEISIPIGQADKIFVGQEVEIISADRVLVKGNISAISPSADPQSRKSLAVVSFLKNDALRLGDLVQISIALERKAGVLAIPLSAVVREYHDDFVMVVNDGKAQKRKIEIGIISENKAEVISGLSNEEVLIIEGQHHLKDGDEIAVR